jgi:hypothetical protein
MCLAAMMIPSPAVRLLVVGVLWVVFLSSFLGVPERAVLTFMVLLPSMALAFPEFAILPAVNFETITIVALAVAVVLSRTDRRPWPSRNPFTASVLYFVALLTFSGIMSYLNGSAQVKSPWSNWTPRAAYEIFADLKSIVFVVFLAPIAFRLLWDPKLVRSAFRLAAVATIFISCDAIWALLDYIVAGEAGSANRAAGFFFDQANMLGSFLAMMTCVFFPVVFGRGLGAGERALFAIATAFSGAGLIFSFSRGAWLGALVGISYLAISQGARVLAFLTVLALTATFWMPSGVFERVGYTFRDPGVLQQGVEFDNSSQIRIRQWDSFLETWLRAPLLGHGHLAYSKASESVTSRGNSLGPHSSTMKLAVEEGIAGLVAYFWLIWVLAKGPRSLASESEDPFLRAVASGFVGALLALLVLDITGQNFMSNRVMIYTWVLGGGLARMAWDQSESDAVQRSSLPSGQSG